MKTTKEILQEFTKEEIINSLLKRKDFHKVDALISELNRVRYDNSFKALDNATQKVIDLRNEQIKLLKELKAIYGDTPILEMRENDRNRLLKLLKDIEAAEKEEDRLNKKYEKETKNLLKN